MESTSKDDIVTMVDVLQEEKDLREQSDAVLSGSDEKKCTYFEGYVKRQALYACLSCVPEAKNDPSKALAICLACSLHCHDKHQEVVELYTKRNVRCDCGVKNGSAPCQLNVTKKINGDQPNEKNKYNQNYSGVYCTCHRPYPDPEDDFEDEMIQCIICEDWYHSRHLNAKVPDASLYSEMICGSCITKNDFLLDYIGYAVQVVDEASRNESNLNITSLDESTAVDEESEEGNAAKRMKLSEDACVRPVSTFNNKAENGNQATFWREEWRKSLCKCVKCVKMYDDHKVEFLTDLDDTTHSYEQKGKEKNPQKTIYEEQLDALSSLPRVNQIDAISSYTRMKDKLFEFLQTFVTNNQIVTEDDVKRFFQNMKENENQNPHQPHFCR